MEKKSIKFELKDLDKEKRIAIIAHAAYDNIDYTKDIARKGMFTKSWNENKDNINFYLNHNDEQAPGKVLDVYEDDNFAYTKAWLGTHTLGNDVLTMMDEGIIKKASFGYYTTKSNPLSIKGLKVRELKEVSHLETSVLTKIPANNLAGVRSVVKSMDTPEIKQFVNAMKAHVLTMENFCYNTKASDEAIKSIQIELENTKQLISEYNTVYTEAGNPLQPFASINVIGALTTFKNSLKT